MYRCNHPYENDRATIVAMVLLLVGIAGLVGGAAWLWSVLVCRRRGMSKLGIRLVTSVEIGPEGLTWTFDDGETSHIGAGTAHSTCHALGVAVDRGQIAIYPTVDGGGTFNLLSPKVDEDKLGKLEHYVQIRYVQPCEIAPPEYFSLMAQTTDCGCSVGSNNCGCWYTSEE